MVDIIECNGMFVVTVFGLPYESYETYAEARDGEGSAECERILGTLGEKEKRVGCQFSIYEEKVNEKISCH